MAESSFKYRILIVEDDPTLREFGKLLLLAQGYEVLCAEDGFEGLAALKQSLPDIIISDLRMPNMNGFEFLSVVRRRFPGIPVIAISGEFSGLSVPESVLADAFFSKGQYQPPQLFEKIVELLQELPTRPVAVQVERNHSILRNAQRSPPVQSVTAICRIQEHVKRIRARFRNQCPCS
jgi:CheY-like chemotaxis protein